MILWRTLLDQCISGLSMSACTPPKKNKKKNKKKNTHFIWWSSYLKSIYSWQLTLFLLKTKELPEILGDICTSTHQICWTEEKITTFNKWICNLTPEVRDILKTFWKREEIAPFEQFLLLTTIFCYLLLNFNVKTEPDFHFEISGYSRQAKLR